MRLDQRSLVTPTGVRPIQSDHHQQHSPNVANRYAPVFSKLAQMNMQGRGCCLMQSAFPAVCLDIATGHRNGMPKQGQDYHATGRPFGRQFSPPGCVAPSPNSCVPHGSAPLSLCGNQGPKGRKVTCSLGYMLKIKGNIVAVEKPNIPFSTPI